MSSVGSLIFVLLPQLLVTRTGASINSSNANKTFRAVWRAALGEDSPLHRSWRPLRGRGGHGSNTADPAGKESLEGKTEGRVDAKVKCTMVYYLNRCT